MRYARIFVFLLLPAASLALTMEVDDFNVEYGLEATYDVSPGGTWAGWDENEDSWDFSSVSGGSQATVTVATPAGHPGASSFPQADYCEVFSQPGQQPQYSYFSLNGNNAVQYGWNTTAMGYEITAVFAPTRNVFVFPFSVGDSWSSSYTYSYEIAGLPVNVNEAHTVSVVGEGRLKVPASGDDWWYTLVLQDYFTYSDSWGNNEARWVYTWAVPDGFAGLNEAVAVQSNPGAAPSFTAYDNRYVLWETTATPEPWVSLEMTTWGAIKSSW